MDRKLSTPVSFDSDLLNELKDQMRGFVTLTQVAKQSGVHPTRVYRTFNPNSPHFDDEVFDFACDMLQTAIEEHNTRISVKEERARQLIAMAKQPTNNIQHV